MPPRGVAPRCTPAIHPPSSNTSYSNRLPPGQYSPGTSPRVTPLFQPPTTSPWPYTRPPGNTSYSNDLPQGNDPQSNKPCANNSPMPIMPITPHPQSNNPWHCPSANSPMLSLKSMPSQGKAPYANGTNLLRQRPSPKAITPSGQPPSLPSTFFPQGNSTIRLPCALPTPPPCPPAV